MLTAIRRPKLAESEGLKMQQLGIKSIRGNSLLLQLTYSLEGTGRKENYSSYTMISNTKKIKG
jgi:hypothetical protein